jgi:Monomeric isocitrate dehydrogenase
VPAFEQVASTTGNAKAKVLADTLDEANGKILEFNRTPARKIGELDNRGSHFYLALYWSEALAAQKDDAELAAKFAPVAKALAENEQKIVAAFAAEQGKPADIGGYYLPKPELLKKWLRPVEAFNQVIDNL